MNKEECLKALKYYWKLFELHRKDYYVSEAREKEIINNIECIENLIEEHFDNQPLKFEDLEENMWVWVKKLNGYFKINSIVNLTKENNKKYVDFGFGYIEFKEEMFYKKEIK